MFIIFETEIFFYPKDFFLKEFTLMLLKIKAWSHELKDIQWLYLWRIHFDIWQN